MNENLINMVSAEINNLLSHKISKRKKAYIFLEQNIINIKKYWHEICDENNYTGNNYKYYCGNINSNHSIRTTLEYISDRWKSPQRL